MISIKKRLDQIESYEKLLEAGIGSYVAALNAVEENLVPVNDDLVAEFRRRLRDLRRAVLTGPAACNLDSASRTLAAELTEYRERAGQEVRQKEQDVREILATLGQAVGTLQRNTGHGGRLLEFAKRIESAAQAPDLRDMRNRIQSEALQMKAELDSMCRDNAGLASQLEAELAAYRRRLETAEALAATDALTGAANRREGERQIAARIADGTRFCILVFDLDRFKTINDQFGHSAGDQVLRGFANRLAAQVRARDMVCRWGGDEFVVILECGLRDAINRARQLSEASRVPAVVRTNEGQWSLPAVASVGVAEHMQGETLEQLFARADAFLYREKGLRKTG